MPNNITNILEISGEGADLVLDEIGGDVDDSGEDIYIDFNKIDPMPEEIMHTNASDVEMASWIIDKLKGDQTAEVDNLRKKMEKLFDNELDQITATLIANAKCGYNNWYSWSYDHWGTKWNAYSQSIKDDQCIIFDTAWSTPYPLMITLSKKFPKNIFTIKYADEDIGKNCGMYVLQNGEVLQEYKPDGDEALMFACEVKG